MNPLRVAGHAASCPAEGHWIGLIVTTWGGIHPQNAKAGTRNAAREWQALKRTRGEAALEQPALWLSFTDPLVQWKISKRLFSHLCSPRLFALQRGISSLASNQEPKVTHGKIHLLHFCDFPSYQNVCVQQSTSCKGCQKTAWKLQKQRESELWLLWLKHSWKFYRNPLLSFLSSKCQ